MNISKFVFIYFLLIQTSLLAFDGREGGGGKGVWDDQKKQLYLYDFWAGNMQDKVSYDELEDDELELALSIKKRVIRSLRSLSKDFFDIDLLVKKLVQIRRIDPVAGEALTEAVSRLRFEVVPWKLNNTKDLKSPFKLKQGQEIQIATRLGNIVSITEEYVKALPLDHVPGLITHEAVYYMIAPKRIENEKGASSLYQDYNNVAATNRYFYNSYLTEDGIEGLKMALDSGRSSDEKFFLPSLPRWIPGISSSFGEDTYAVYFPHSREPLSYLITHIKVSKDIPLDHYLPNIYVRNKGRKIQFNPAIVVVRQKHSRGIRDILDSEFYSILYKGEDREVLNEKINALCVKVGGSGQALASFQLHEFFQEITLKEEPIITPEKKSMSILRHSVNYKSNIFNRSMQARFSNSNECSNYFKNLYDSWELEAFFQSFR